MPNPAYLLNNVNNGQKKMSTMKEILVQIEKANLKHMPRVT